MQQNAHIHYVLEDGRQVEIEFNYDRDGVVLNQRFQPENENSHEAQRLGGQSILESFKRYVEAKPE